MNGHIVRLNRWKEFFGCLLFGSLYFLNKIFSLNLCISDKFPESVFCIQFADEKDIVAFIDQIIVQALYHHEFFRAYLDQTVFGIVKKGVSLNDVVVGVTRLQIMQSLP